MSACRRVLEYTEGYTPARYLSDPKTRDAVERQLCIAGEAVVQLRKLDRLLAERLGPIDQVAGFRNILVHGYFRLNAEDVWKIVEEHVPMLLAASEQLLAGYQFPEDTDPAL